MNFNQEDRARLKFLVRVVQKQIRHLVFSQAHVFSQPFTVEQARMLETDEEWAEKVEAFNGRFCRLQDTVGDKLIPLWLRLLGEPLSAAIDNLDKAEKIGVLLSSEQWMEVRQLRNKMVHEYIEDMDLLATALQTANQRVPLLKDTTQRILEDLSQRGWI